MNQITLPIDIESLEIVWDEYKNFDIIGLDEISMKKDHKSYVTIVTAI